MLNFQDLKIELDTHKKGRCSGSVRRSELVNAAIFVD